MIELLLYTILAVAVTSAILYIIRRRVQLPARIRDVLTVVVIVVIILVFVRFVLGLGGIP